jgi:Uma2 family endonuclease
VNQYAPVIAAEPTSFRARFSADEFAAMLAIGAFDDMRVELIDGELDRMPPANNGHSLLHGRVYARLLAAVTEDRLRLEVAVRLTGDVMVGSDVVVLREPVTENRPLAPAEVVLVVEVADATIARDLGLKRERYAAAGIPTYWVIDVERQVTFVHDELAGGAYARVRTFRFAEPLPVPETEAAITLA